MQKEKVWRKIKRAAIGNYCRTALQKNKPFTLPKNLLPYLEFKQPEDSWKES